MRIKNHCVYFDESICIHPNGLETCEYETCELYYSKEQAEEYMKTYHKTPLKSKEIRRE